MTLNDQYQKWKEVTLKKSLDKFKERKDRFEYSSGIEVPRLSLPPTDDSAYEEKLGFPGEYPYTRGVQPTMYRS
ncbi:MAG TPA: methylmalonyl-CoA mutase family protein, partial [Anaerolineales bacterium]|nr:methylmalonyl-CoA mutase family protein [Anaerolineales bacterium]